MRAKFSAILLFISCLTLATLFQNCGGGPQSPTMDNSLASHLVPSNPYYNQQNILVDVTGMTQITVSLANHGIYFSDLDFSNLALGTASSGPTADLNLQANVIPIEDIPCPPASAAAGTSGPTTLNLSAASPGHFLINPEHEIYLWVGFETDKLNLQIFEKKPKATAAQFASAVCSALTAGPATN